MTRKKPSDAQTQGDGERELKRVGVRGERVSFQGRGRQEERGTRALSQSKGTDTREIVTVQCAYTQRLNNNKVAFTSGT